MTKSRLFDGVRLYEHYQEPDGNPIASLPEYSEHWSAQSRESIIHYCRQYLQYLINTLVDPKLGVILPKTLPLDAGIIQEQLMEIYDALSYALQLPTQTSLTDFIHTEERQVDDSKTRVAPHL